MDNNSQSYSNVFIGRSNKKKHLNNKDKSLYKVNFDRKDLINIDKSAKIKRFDWYR